MNDTSRVGNITSSTGISTSNSWNSSGGKTSNASAGGWAVGSISSSSKRITSISISIRISNMSSISVSSIEESWVSFSISLTLSNMNDTSRVGNITSSTGISTSNSWNSSGGKTSNASAGGWAVGSISSSSKRITSISISIRISNMSSISVSSIEESWVSFSLSLTLSNMNDSSRVGNITSSTGISTS